MSDEVETNILYLGQPGDAGRKGMSDLANLLRVIAKEMAEYDEPPSWHQPIVEAADEIEKLRAELKHARRDALEEAARIAENEPEPEGDPPPELHGRSVKNIAIASVRATKRSIAAAIRALGEK
jgi:hypothetical protein